MAKVRGTRSAALRRCLKPGCAAPHSLGGPAGAIRDPSSTRRPTWFSS